MIPELRIETDRASSGLSNDMVHHVSFGTLDLDGWRWRSHYHVFLYLFFDLNLLCLEILLRLGLRID